MNKRHHIICILAIAIILAGCTKNEVNPEPAKQVFSSVDITGSPWGKDFQLTDHHGQQRRLSDFGGKVVTVFFGYTNCPDMCPMTMHKWSTVMEQLGKDADKVQVLFVTLDPNRDRPEILKQYVPAFHPTFLGMYGDDQATEYTAKDFKVYYKHQKPDTNGFYSVDHMGPSYVFDPQGRLRLFVSDEHSVESIVKDMRTLLKG